MASENRAESGRAIVHEFVCEYYPAGVVETYHVPDDDGEAVCGADVDSDPEKLELPPHAQGAICDDCGGAESLQGAPTCPNCGQAITRQHRVLWVCLNDNCQVKFFEVRDDGE